METSEFISRTERFKAKVKIIFFGLRKKTQAKVELTDQTQPHLYLDYEEEMANIGVPTKLLHESLGHVITVELKTGQVYRGKLFDGKFVFVYSFTITLPSIPTLYEVSLAVD